MRCFSKRLHRLVLVSVLAALVGCTSPDETETATLVITGARIWTGEPSLPWAEAIAVLDDRILAVGSDEEIVKLIGDASITIDGRGRMVTPGFIDTHVHFVQGGQALASVQLRDAKTPEEFTRRIAEFAASAEPGEWITGGAWDHENWGGELPRRSWIDEVTPENPVWIDRLDGHMALANSLALELAGVHADTPDVDGGEVVRDAEGNPTGVLKDNAMALILQAMPPMSDEQMDRAIVAAMNYVAANGVTTVHDMADFDSMAAYERLRGEGELITRIYSVVPLNMWKELQAKVEAQGNGDDWLRIGGLKGFMDGSLGSHTAAFFEPFTDTPGDRGFLINEIDDMREWIADADAAGLHVIVHAIGDRAIRELLDIYVDVTAANGDRDRRFRIEHAQHIHPDDVRRFAAQNVIASMQPYHAIDDGRWAERVIGKERAQTTYAFKSLIDSGARVAFGSDWYVAPPSVVEGIYAAVTRRTLAGAHPGGWVPAQKITVEQALAAYTVQGAYASFEEDIKGSLSPGKLADIVILERDITAIPEEEIRGVKVMKTIVGGEVVYTAD